MARKLLLVMGCLLLAVPCFCWGFFGHRTINRNAVFLLPPEMLHFYKYHIGYLTDHAVDADKRRYAVANEGPRHYIDLDRYGSHPFNELPRRWEDAVEKFGEDTLTAHGIVPWHIQKVLYQLTEAFKNKDYARILRYSADIGHYISDAHVPLHASSNHNGQHTDQHGIHGFWESRIPELLAERQFDFFIGSAVYIEKPSAFIWDRVLESAAAVDTVLKIEKWLSEKFQKKTMAFEKRNATFLRQYSSDYTIAYNEALNGMVERRMRESILAVASFWYTAWVNAGQPDLSDLLKKKFSENDLIEMEQLNKDWRNNHIKGREHE